MEDYSLFVRMIDGGARVANVAEPLAKYRVGAGGYLSRLEYARSVLVRGGYRLVPESVRRAAHRRYYVSRLP